MKSATGVFLLLLVLVFSCNDAQKVETPSEGAPAAAAAPQPVPQLAKAQQGVVVTLAPVADGGPLGVIEAAAGAPEANARVASQVITARLKTLGADQARVEAGQDGTLKVFFPYEEKDWNAVAPMLTAHSRLSFLLVDVSPELLADGEALAKAWLQTRGKPEGTIEVKRDQVTGLMLLCNDKDLLTEFLAELKASGNPAALNHVLGIEERGQRFRAWFLLPQPGLSNQHISKVVPFSGQGGVTFLSVQLTEDGAKALAEITGANIGKPLAILLDGRVWSAAVVGEKIEDGRAQLSPRPGATPAQAMTEMNALARTISQGLALPMAVKVTGMETYKVGE